MQSIKLLAALLATTMISGTALATNDKDSKNNKSKSSGLTTYSSKGFGSSLWGKTLSFTPPKIISSSSGGYSTSASSSGGYSSSGSSSGGSTSGGSSSSGSSGGSSSGGSSSGGAPTPVPEPATLALMGTGLGMLALRRRRRKA